MPKDFKYLYDHWEDELLNITHEAIECAIASAYLSTSGVDILSKVANRLAEFASKGSKTLIKVILSDQFAPTKSERVHILKKISELPGVEVRIYCDSKFQHRKNYIFRTNEEIRVIVGSVNVTSAGFFKNLEMATLAIHEKNDPEAMKVISEFESCWLKSKPLQNYMEVENMPENAPRFSVGENVRIINTVEIGTVNKLNESPRGYSYKVTINGKTKTIAERFLETIPGGDTESKIIEDFINDKLGDHDQYKLFQTWFRLTKPIESNLYSYLGSKTLFNPHQFKPLLRFLSYGSDERLFIADEVGVGKTIETGIILNELMARGRLNHPTPQAILIVCPNSLGPKWVDEMKNRFGLDFYLHDSDSLKFALETTSQDKKFPPRFIFSVVGLQLIRGKEYLKLLRKIDEERELPVFGMVVIDEAHHMRNPETDSNELGNLLSNMTEMMLMLSATPLNLRNEDLYNQMHILNPAAFPDKTTFETLQNPVIKLNQIRRLIVKNTVEAMNEILYKLQEFERDPMGKVLFSHPFVTKFIERLKEKNPFSSEEIVKYERLFVSLSPLYYSFTRTRKREAFEHLIQREVWELPIYLSNQEMKFHNDVLEAIKNYYLLTGGEPQAIGFILNTHRRMVSSCIPAMRIYLEWCIKENRLSMGETENSEDLEDDSQLETVELNQVLKQEFSRLLNEVKELEENDSKYNQLKNMIEKLLADPKIPQVMIFSFFIRTLKYLEKRLKKDGYTVGIIHGEIPLKGNTRILGRDNIMEGFKKEEYKILLSSEVGGEGLDFQYCSAIVNYDLPYNPMRIEQRIGRIDRFGQKADKIIVSNLFIKGTVDEEIYDRLYRRIRLVEDGIGSLEPILGKQLSNIQTAIITGILTDEQKEEISQKIDKAVASTKIEMEEFEKYRGELLSDDYLSKPINNITKGDFVSPDDAIQLTKQCLSRWEDCRFMPTKDRCGEMALSEKMISRIDQFLRRPGNERGYNELKPLLSSKKHIKVIFDGSIAENNPDHIFLSPTGYWTRFLTYELEKENAILKTFSFRIKSSELDITIGEYIVFLFEVRMVGIKTEIEFLGIPLNINTKSVIETCFESFPRLLANAEGLNNQSLPDDIDLNSYLDSARDFLDQILEDKRKATFEENRYMVESRIAALKKSSEIKNKKLQQQIENHIVKRSNENKEPDEDFLRLTNGKIEKEKIRVESKISELHKHQDLSVDSNLEAIIYLKVT
jgi:ERCC4-related helicase